MRGGHMAVVRASIALGLCPEYTEKQQLCPEGPSCSHAHAITFTAGLNGVNLTETVKKRQLQFCEYKQSNELYFA